MGCGFFSLSRNKTTKILTDQQTIKGCKKGIEQSHAQFYKDCAPYVYSLVKRYIVDVGFRKDMMQEVFAKVFLNIKSFDERKGTLNVWVRKITVNECLQHLRKSRLLFVAEGIDDAQHAIDDAPLPTDLTREDVSNILERMPKGYKLVFMLSVIDGFTHQEIGEQLKITQQTSRSQLTRAKKWIERFLYNQHKSDLYGLL